MASIGLTLIFLGWLAQLIDLKSSKTRLSRTMLLMYILGVSMLIVYDINLRSWTTAAINSLCFIAAGLVWIRVKK